jgi:DNA segregation ATPase FtsK/SpoIIIE, S-DNA-T family
MVKRSDLPIEHWSYSSLISYLRNPLAWHKRYVQKVYDMPSTPAGVVGRAAHKALEHFYSGVSREYAIEEGMRFLRNVSDFEINFGTAVSKRAQKEKRKTMEREYAQAIRFYLAKPPRHAVVGVEVMGMAKVKGIPIPIKAVSDLVVESRSEKGALDIVDHKFVDTFSKDAHEKPLFLLQALFNYYTVQAAYGLPVRRMLIQECKKRKNKDGTSQMRRYVIDFTTLEDEFDVFHRILKDATNDLATRRFFLPNPSDMYEGSNSFDIYRLGL